MSSNPNRNVNALVWGLSCCCTVHGEKDEHSLLKYVLKIWFCVAKSWLWVCHVLLTHVRVVLCAVKQQKQQLRAVAITQRKCVDLVVVVVAIIGIDERCCSAAAAAAGFATSLLRESKRRKRRRRRRERGAFVRMYCTVRRDWLEQNQSAFDMLCTLRFAALSKHTHISSSDVLVCVYVCTGCAAAAIPISKWKTSIYKSIRGAEETAWRVVRPPSRAETTQLARKILETCCCWVHCAAAEQSRAEQNRVGCIDRFFPASDAAAAAAAAITSPPSSLSIDAEMASSNRKPASIRRRFYWEPEYRKKEGKKEERRKEKMK